MNEDHHSLPSQNSGHYDVWKLLSRRYFSDYSTASQDLQIICDIDKTYLETQFSSLIDIAKIALEQARDKVTAAGATEMLLALRWGDQNSPLPKDGRTNYPRPLHFLSSSPPQLRKTLTEKLCHDGLDWTSDTLKDQAYNLKKGRFKLLRKQVAYKTAALLTLFNQSEGGSYILIGDSAETDGYIYLGMKLFTEGRLSRNGFRRFIEIAEVPEVESEAILQVTNELVQTKTIPLILIRNLNEHRLPKCSPLTDPITTFQDYFQGILHCLKMGFIDPQCLRADLHHAQSTWIFTGIATRGVAIRS